MSPEPLEKKEKSANTEGRQNKKLFDESEQAQEEDDSNPL